MKVIFTIESDSVEDIQPYTKTDALRSAIFELDQDLRAVVKYGGTNCGSLRLTEGGDDAEYYEKVRSHLHKVLNDYNVSDFLL